MVLYEFVWFHAVPYGSARFLLFCVVLCGSVWSCMIRYNSLRFCMILYGCIQFHIFLHSCLIPYGSVLVRTVTYPSYGFVWFCIPLYGCIKLCIVFAVPYGSGWSWVVLYCSVLFSRFVWFRTFPLVPYGPVQFNCVLYSSLIFRVVRFGSVRFCAIP